METFKFSSMATDEPPDILQGRTERDFLRAKYTRGCIFGLDDLQRSGVYRFMGWKYNFRQFLKAFVVKQHGSWQEYFAPNKTALRTSIYGKIQKIVEL
jgi:hypothetical protein